MIEAICQLKLARHSKWTPATAGQLWEELEPDYPLDIEEQQGVQASLTLTQSGLQSSLEPQTKRVIFRNKDRNKAAVLGPDVVSTNGLPEYQGWDDLLERLKLAFDVYGRVVDHAARAAVVSLRYVNHIRIPHSSVNTDDYFRLPVVAAYGSDAEVAGYVMRSETHLVNSGTSVSIGFGTMDSGSMESSFLLDIDVKRSIPADYPIQKVWDIADELHTIENTQFENSITPLARELFR